MFLKLQKAKVKDVPPQDVLVNAEDISTIQTVKGGTSVVMRGGKEIVVEQSMAALATAVAAKEVKLEKHVGGAIR